ncbi:MAG TPA: protease HtpX [Gammaproteobacteria bacterium]|nr:protease HtpX [Gammaproteobacteria bacterium]
MLRIALFLATNVAIMVVLTIVMGIISSVFGIQLGGYNRMLVISAVIGFSGALISLFMSKMMAKRSMGVQVIEQPSNGTEQWLVQTVAAQAQRAGISMPEVGIFHSPDPNAFATGWNRNAALVAVSTGLLQSMSKDEVEAVLAHEISHVSNGDMVTMTLVQGVVNTFVYFFAMIIGRFVDRVVFKNEEGVGFGYYITQMIAQVVLSFLASIIVMWFSRWREFRADAGGARLAGREKMIAALERLKSAHEPAEMPAEMAAFGIHGGEAIKSLFRSHPPLEDRIAALRNQA